jgi:hypothetical protein
MSHIQTFLVIGGMVLLSVLVMNFYQITSVQIDTRSYNEAIITGTAIGQSLFEEISTKAFDENTISKMIGSVDSLSAVLGPDFGENNRALFDDVDDYNNYQSSDSLAGLGKFNYKIRVHYVQRLNPDVISNVRTFAKRVDVSITNRYISDTLRLNHVYAF